MVEVAGAVQRGDLHPGRGSRVGRRRLGPEVELLLLLRRRRGTHGSRARRRCPICNIFWLKY